MKYIQTVTLLLSVASTTLAQSFCNASGHSGQSVQCNSNKTGNIGGVGYELWSDSGNNSATFYSDGSFSCSFQGAGDYLCRSGLSFDSTKTPAQLGGRLKADFKLVKGNVSNAQYSYVGIYGWTRSPLVEYYIVDNWLGGKPGDWVGNKKHGAFTIDGAQYTVYENTRTGPSIDGDTTFKQYFSIRDSPRECGTIDISAHFDQWEKLGMAMGKLHEAKILGEAGGGTSGTIDFPYAKVYTGDSAPAGGNGGGAPAQGGQDQGQQGQGQQGQGQQGQGQAPPQGQPGQDQGQQGQQGGQQPPQGQPGQDQGQQGQQGGQQPPQGGNQGWNQGGFDFGNQGGNQGWGGNQGGQGGFDWGNFGGNQGGNQGWGGNQGGNQGWGGNQGGFDWGNFGNWGGNNGGNNGGWGNWGGNNGGNNGGWGGFGGNNGGWGQPQNNAAPAWHWY